MPTRNNLYSPLSNDITSSESFSISSNSDINFYSFLGQISYEFHYPKTVSDSHNFLLNDGGSKNLHSVQYYQKELDYRTLNITGNNIKFHRKEVSKHICYPVESLFTPYRIEANSLRKKKSNVSLILFNNDKKITSTLMYLNNIWNNYIHRLILSTSKVQRKNKDMMSYYRDKILSKILENGVELVGSYVRIMSCDSHFHYIGTCGFVLDVTENTWRIAILKYKEKMYLTGTKRINVKPSFSEKLDQLWRVIVVPKKKSSLSFSISFNENKFIVDPTISAPNIIMTAVICG